MYWNWSHQASLLAVSGGTATAAPLEMAALLTPAAASQYLLCMMLYGLAILLSSPPSPRLLRLHLGILVFADFTHWWGLFSTLAAADPLARSWWVVALDPASYTPEVWSLAIGPFATLSIKIATLAGWFGKIGG